MSEKMHNKTTNLRKALNALKLSVSTPIAEKRDLSGIIKDFELVYELIWKALKLRLAEMGHESGTAREVFGVAYQVGMIDKEDVWLEIIKDRNLTVHTYEEKFAKEMVDRIKSRYVTEFEKVTAGFPI